MASLDHLILKVNDLAESVAFYTQVLGFADEGRDGPFTVIRVGPDFQLQLAPWGTSGFEHYAFVVSRSEFERIFERIRTSGIAYGPTFDSVGTNVGPGAESGARGMAPTVYFNDPNRHLLEIRAYEVWLAATNDSGVASSVAARCRSVMIRRARRTSDGTASSSRAAPNAAPTSRSFVTIAPRLLALLLPACLVGGCAGLPSGGPAASTVTLPLRAAWYDGRAVSYITTDVSDAAAARDEGANFAPRLAAALDAPPTQRVTERVYTFSNTAQRPVFQSAPNPLGAASTDRSYSPLWRKVAVTWRDAAAARELRSEEAVLAAEDRGQVVLSITNVLLNCPILSVEGAGVLVGVEFPSNARGRR